MRRIGYLRMRQIISLRNDEKTCLHTGSGPPAEVTGCKKGKTEGLRPPVFILCTQAYRQFVTSVTPLTDADDENVAEVDPR